VPVHPWSRAISATQLLGAEIFSRVLAAAVIPHNVEGNLLPLDKAAETRTLHRTDVDENVRSTLIRLNESKALGGIEEFYNTGVHDDFLSIEHKRSLAVQNAQQDFKIEVERGRSSARFRRRKSSTAKSTKINIDVN
jgi:hypothetical protein